MSGNTAGRNAELPAGLRAFWISWMARCRAVTIFIRFWPNMKIPMLAVLSIIPPI